MKISTKILVSAFMFAAAYLSTHYAVLFIIPVLLLPSAKEFKPTAYKVMITIILWVIISIVSDIVLGPNVSYLNEYNNFYLPNVIKPILFVAMFVIDSFSKKKVIDITESAEVKEKE